MKQFEWRPSSSNPCHQWVSEVLSHFGLFGRFSLCFLLARTGFSLSVASRDKETGDKWSFNANAVLWSKQVLIPHAAGASAVQVVTTRVRELGRRSHVPSPLFIRLIIYLFLDSDAVGTFLVSFMIFCTLCRWNSGVQCEYSISFFTVFKASN